MVKNPSTSGGVCVIEPEKNISKYVGAQTIEVYKQNLLVLLIIAYNSQIWVEWSHALPILLPFNLPRSELENRYASK